MLCVLVARTELMSSGLDNAGKTTIVKRVNGEDIMSVSPTLGFNITTLQHRGCARSLQLV